jgi:deaminated glutathione amidase
MPTGDLAMTYLAAAIQMNAGPDKAANLERAERLVRLGAARGANLVALPEVFNWRGKRNDQAAAAETLDGQSLTLMSRLARELQIHLVAGSITEHVAGDARCYNTSVLLGPDGQQLAAYRKIHLFDVDLPGRVTVRESDAKLAGADVVTASTPLGAIGLSICYDLRFPELYRRLTFAGAQILSVPSAFTFPTGEAHWEPLIRARAIENQAYVIAPAQFGPNIYGYSDYGNSMIVDPWGRVLARAADQEGVVVAPIDLEYQERVRRELPALKHARLKGE